MTRPTRLILVAGTATEIGKTWIGGQVLDRLPSAGGQTAVNNNGVPHIPEPDYDISDAENGSYSGSDSSWRNGGGSGGMAPSEDPIGTRGREPSTATLRRNQQQRQDRKKKKTVSFIMNQDIANIIHSSGTMTKKESILKVIFH